MGCKPGFSLLDALTGHAFSLGNLLLTVDVANIMWAFGQLSYKPHATIIEGLWGAAIENMPQSDGRAVSGLVASAQKLGHKPSISSLVTIVDHLLSIWEEISPREMATIFISMVRLGYKPHDELLLHMDAKLLDSFDGFSNRDITLYLNGLRLTRNRPSAQCLQKILTRKFEQDGQSKSKDRDVAEIKRLMKLFDPK